VGERASAVVPIVSNAIQGPADCQVVTSYVKRINRIGLSETLYEELTIFYFPTMPCPKSKSIAEGSRNVISQFSARSFASSGRSHQPGTKPGYRFSVWHSSDCRGDLVDLMAA
jgi:hypothetical protein